MKKHLLSLTAIRRIIFLLLLLTSFILQFSVLAKTAIPFPVFLLIPLTTAITMHEKDFGGLFWGALAGILWDTASPVTDGAYALIFAVIFLITGLLTRHVMRNTLLTAMLFTAVWSAFPVLLQIVYFHKALTGEIFTLMLADGIVPAIAVSVILCIPLYPLIGAVTTHFRKERQ